MMNNFALDYILTKAESQNDIKIQEVDLSGFQITPEGRPAYFEYLVSQNLLEKLETDKSKYKITDLGKDKLKSNAFSSSDISDNREAIFRKMFYLAGVGSALFSLLAALGSCFAAYLSYKNNNSNNSREPINLNIEMQLHKDTLIEKDYKDQDIKILIDYEGNKNGDY